MIQTTTVGELKSMLDRFDDSTPVVAVSNYGDRCGTMQAIPVGEDLELSTVEESSYSDSGYKVVGDEAEEGDENAVLVLNYDSSDY